MKKLLLFCSCLTAVILMSACTTDNDESTLPIHNDSVINPPVDPPPPPPVDTGGDTDKDIDKTKTKP